MDTGMACLATVVAIALVALLSGAVLMFGWNVVVPIFWVVAPKITFWQALLAGLFLSVIGSFFKK